MNKQTIKGYKATDKNGKCQGFQYEVGKTYEFSGDIKLCERGFHFCKIAHDVINHYSGHDCRYFEVEALGEVKEDGDKCVTNIIKIVREITKNDLLQQTIKPDKVVSAHSSTTGDRAHSSTAGDWAHSSTTGDRAHSSTAGYRAHSSTEGDWAHSSTSGDRAHSSTSGDRAHSSTSGNYADSSTSGDWAHSSASGDWAHSSTSGDWAHSSTTGDWAHSSTTGDWAHSSTTGDWAHSSASGDRAHSSTSGDGAHSSTSGDRAHSSTTGEDCISFAAGLGSKARARKGFIVIANWENVHGKYTLKEVFAKKVGQRLKGVKIKPDCWYWFENGVLMEEKA